MSDLVAGFFLFGLLCYSSFPVLSVAATVLQFFFSLFSARHGSLTFSPVSSLEVLVSCYWRPFAAVLSPFRISDTEPRSLSFSVVQPAVLVCLGRFCFPTSGWTHCGSVQKQKHVRCREYDVSHLQWTACGQFDRSRSGRRREHIGNTSGKRN